ncbi:MAG: glutamate 5-kinase [Alphaproteobacteria bacterium]|nr:glutamate 5-kinase [Alphaproteobacteria bacterium]
MIIESAERIVIKVGSAILVDSQKNGLRQEWLASLSEDIAQLVKRGKEVAVVTSGAVALGCEYKGMDRSKLKIEEKQAMASVGQALLIHHYRKSLLQFEMDASQILLTLDDSEDRRRYLNARNTMQTLLKMRIVPIINENDTVATDEMRFGDNDRLAARVAQMMGADLLVLLSDIDGLYTANPHKDPSAHFVSEVKTITQDIEQMAGGSISNFGTGGMISKIAAAKIAVAGGCHMVILKGHDNHPLRRLEEGERHTHFFADRSPLKARKHWIRTSIKPHGTIIVDDGAARALLNGNSLLAVGVKGVKGDFDRGDVVTVVDGHGKEIARGLIAYSSQDAGRIMGKNSDDIESILGYIGRMELIHRDDLVLTEPSL